MKKYVEKRNEGRRRGKAGSWGWAQKCAGVARLVRGNADEGAQARGGSCVGIRAKVRRRGAARGSECGRRYAGGGRLVGGYAGEGTQTWGGSCAGLSARVGLGARGMLIGIHRNLSEPIGIYRRDAAHF